MTLIIYFSIQKWIRLKIIEVNKNVLFQTDILFVILKIAIIVLEFAETSELVLCVVIVITTSFDWLVFTVFSCKISNVCFSHSELIYQTTVCDYCFFFFPKFSFISMNHVSHSLWAVTTKEAYWMNWQKRWAIIALTT